MNGISIIVYKDGGIALRQSTTKDVHDKLVDEAIKSQEYFSAAFSPKFITEDSLHKGSNYSEAIASKESKPV